MTLKFKVLLRDPDTNLHAVCDFLGLSFDPGMLKYHASTSYDPPDASMAEKWRRLASPVELMQLEARAGDLMLQRGYLLSGPVIRIGRLELARLWLRNKFAIWRFGMRRFGALVFIGRKITYHLGAKGLENYFRQRMDAITLRHLK